MTNPSKERPAFGKLQFTRTDNDLAFSLMRAAIACSADEILFLMLVEDHGLEEATQLAAKYDLRCVRPLNALLQGA